MNTDNDTNNAAAELAPLEEAERAAAAAARAFLEAHDRFEEAVGRLLHARDVAEDRTIGARIQTTAAHVFVGAIGRGEVRAAYGKIDAAFQMRRMEP